MGFLGDLFGGLLSSAGSIVSAIPGVGTLAGSLIGAAGNALGGAVSGASSQGDSKDLINLQYDRQAQENALNRQFQSDEWTRQFNLTNAYNTPAEQAKRLQQARINPAVAFQGTQTSAMSSASPAAPSGASGLSAFDPSGVLSLGFRSQESLMNRLKLFNEVQKGRYEISDVLPAQVRGILASAANDEVENEVRQFDLGIKKIFGRNMENAKLQNLLADYEVKLAEQKLKLKQGEVADADILFKESERLLNESKKHLTNKEYQKLEVELRYYGKRLESEIRALNAQAHRDESSAQTEDVLRDFRKDLLANEADVSNETKLAKIENIQQEYLTKWLENQADSREAERRLEYIKSIIGKRDRSFVFKEVDDFLTWLASKIGLSLSGSVSTSSKTETRNYNVNQ